MRQDLAGGKIESVHEFADGLRIRSFGTVLTDRRYYAGATKIDDGWEMIAMSRPRIHNSRWSLYVIVVATLVAATAAEAAPWEGMGPLQAHPDNSRYFVDAKRRTVWLTGSHTWAFFQERGVEGQTPDFDYQGYLQFLQARGHNFLRLWTWEHAQWMQFADRDTPVRYKPLAYQRTGPGTALDGKPKFDLAKFNDEFFRRLRERAEAARDRGIYVGVMFFAGFSIDKTGGNSKKGNAWHGHPFHPANNINRIDGNPSHDDTGREIHELKVPQVTRLQEAYVREVIHTLGDLENVLWEIGNECHTESVAWQHHMIRFVKTCEAGRPTQHPVGMTVPIGAEELFASPADWISPPGRSWLTDPPVNDGRKVIIVDTDHCDSRNHDPTWVWKTLFRGHHFILMDWYRDYRLGSPKEPNPEWEVTRSAMGRARELAEQIDLAKVVPRPTLSSTKYCLANPATYGIAYAVYLPNGKSAEVDLSATKEVLGVEWLDPVSGKRESSEEVVGGAKRRFRPPFNGPAILLLRRTPAASSPRRSR